LKFYILLLFYTFRLKSIQISVNKYRDNLAAVESNAELFQTTVESLQTSQAETTKQLSETAQNLNIKIDDEIANNKNSQQKFSSHLAASREQIMIQIKQLTRKS